MKRFIVFIISIFAFNTFAGVDPSQKAIDCRAILPIILAPKSVVTLASTNTDQETRNITFKKDSKSAAKKFNAKCSIQASMLLCSWETGKILIDTSHVLKDDGMVIGGSRVGGYEYFEAKTIIKRAILNKTESVRCRIK